MAGNKEVSTGRIYASIVCISLLQGLQFAPSPVLSKITEHFPQVPVSMVQMLITGPSLVALVFGLLSGVMVTKVSVKRQLLAASVLTAVCGLVPFLADSFWLLFGARMVYGVSLGLCTALNTAVVAQWFQGPARVRAMGIQSASIGIGIAAVSAVAGRIGQQDFRLSYLVYLVAVASFVVIALCLPETGTVQVSAQNKITVNGRVFVIASLGLLEFLFLMSFSTNIAMHMGGSLAGDAAKAGILTSAFSVGMILIGFVLTPISKVLKKWTIPVAMLAFSVGGIFLICFPSSFAGLFLGAVFCGVSQGIFVPTGFVEVANAVPPASAAIASGFQTGGQCIGQLLSPVVLNGLAAGILGSASTGNVYIVAAVGMVLASVYAAFAMNKK